MNAREKINSSWDRSAESKRRSACCNSCSSWEKEWENGQERRMIWGQAPTSLRFCYCSVSPASMHHKSVRMTLSLQSRSARLDRLLNYRGSEENKRNASTGYVDPFRERRILNGEILDNTHLWYCHVLWKQKQQRIKVNRIQFLNELRCLFINISHSMYNVISIVWPK